MRLRLGLPVTVAVLCMATLCVSCKDQRDPWDDPAPEVIAEDPTWTPDGSRVVYTCHGHILSVDLQGNTTSVSGSWPYYTGCPDVSPDGHWLLFVTGTQVYKAMLGQDGVIDSAAVVPLTDRGRNFDPAWSPSGQRVAYVSNLEGDSVVFYGICTMDADGTNKSRMPDSGGDARAPRWSPDGSMVVYNGYVGHGGAEILVTSADGTGRRLLTNDTLDDLDPDWSPDGRKIAFARYTANGRGKSPGYVICQVDTAGQEIDVVTMGRNPEWTPDGQGLVFEDLAEDAQGDYSTLFMIDVKNRERRQLVWR